VGGILPGFEGGVRERSRQREKISANPLICLGLRHTLWPLVRRQMTEIAVDICSRRANIFRCCHLKQRLSGLLERIYAK